ncbi:bactofilin family protein [Effusibacillus consociatus]|uniref:Polymer-forming cytoskeletal protein n=1 Tax=Effusibacillus consociatus TaxID=1117041 RepID=A0ABV9Q4G4_9BACL
MFKKEAPLNSGKVDTLIGAGTTIEGKVQASGILRVEGRIGGEVISEGDVIVGEKGEIRANIKARHVTIAGKVAGNITASGRMHLVSSGSLEGDIDAATIAIEEGAHFKGACRMSAPSNGKGRSSVSGKPADPQPVEPATSGTNAYFQNSNPA